MSTEVCSRHLNYVSEETKEHRDKITIFDMHYLVLPIFVYTAKSSLLLVNTSGSKQQRKTASIKPFGIYQHKRIQFSNRSHFITLNERFKSSKLKISLLVYVNDFIIMSPSYEKKQILHLLTSFKNEVPKVI